MTNINIITQGVFMESPKTQLQKIQLASLLTMPADTLDKRGQEGDTVLMEECPYTEGFIDPPLLGGWICKYVGLRDVNATGRIILLPNTDWTRKLWRQGQVLFAVSQGLSQEHAERWVASRVAVKHEILDVLIKVLASTELQEMYKQYEVDGDRDSYLKWQSRTGISDGLSGFKRGMLVRLVEEILNPKRSTRRKPQTATTSE